MKIMFVCLGNICRSPLAEAIAKEKFINHPEIEIFSAGLGNKEINQAPCYFSQKIAKLNGLDISEYRATQITKEHIEDYNLYIALDQSHYKKLIEYGAKNIYKLGHFGLKNKDIEDPFFFNNYSDIEAIFEEIIFCISNFYKFIEEQ